MWYPLSRRARTTAGVVALVVLVGIVLIGVERRATGSEARNIYAAVLDERFESYRDRDRGEAVVVVSDLPGALPDPVGTLTILARSPADLRVARRRRGRVDDEWGGGSRMQDFRPGSMHYTRVGIPIMRGPLQATVEVSWIGGHLGFAEVWYLARATPFSPWRVLNRRRTWMT